MINVRHAKEFCSGDITKIENYEVAMNDNNETRRKMSISHKKENI